jgi:hypothetical protein
MQSVDMSPFMGLFDDQPKIRSTTNGRVRSSPGHRVTSYLELATKIAELQFYNNQHVLLFRGQSSDYRNLKGNSTLKPSLFRHRIEDKNNPPDAGLLLDRFELLKHAERQLVETFRNKKLVGRDRLVRHRLLRWAILQHYEVCGTPLLDVTHSLRIAASFASHGKTEECFLYVLAVPNISGTVTVSADAGLQIVKLSGICPPDAVRPHIQEGYLLGEYPDMPDMDQKQMYRPYEIDFGLRLVAKFRFDKKTLWRSRDFKIVPRRALYPSPKKDPICRILKRTNG